MRMEHVVSCCQWCVVFTQLMTSAPHFNEFSLKSVKVRRVVMKIAILTWPDTSTAPATVELSKLMLPMICLHLRMSVPCRIVHNHACSVTHTHTHTHSTQSLPSHTILCKVLQREMHVDTVIRRDSLPHSAVSCLAVRLIGWHHAVSQLCALRGLRLHRRAHPRECQRELQRTHTRTVRQCHFALGSKVQHLSVSHFELP